MTFHSPGPENQDKVKSNPYTEGGAGNPQQGNNPASANKSGANQPGVQGKKKAKQAHVNEVVAKSADQDNSQATAQSKKPGTAEVASENKQPEGTKGTETKPGLMEILRESARTVDPEERKIAYINPMSALKLGLAVNVCLLVILLVASIVIYAVLGLAGVWDNLNSLLGDLTGMGSFGFGQYLAIVVSVGLLEVVVFTLLAPVLAIMYNLAAKLVGGLSVTVNGDAVGSAGNGTLDGAVNGAGNGVRKVD